MACYKLSSCTPGAAVVLCSDLPDLIPFIGGTVTLPGLYPGVCFTVEEVLPPCDCCPVLTPLTLEDLGSTCPCTNDTVCYLLTDCNNPAIVYSTLTNLNPYVGQNISVTEYLGCFTVTSQPIEMCADTSPVTCIETCVCPPAGYCFDLQNCDDPLAILPITTSFIITPGQVVSLLPGEIPPAFAGFPNCWTSLGDRPCDGSEYVITSVNNEVDCESCLGPSTYCYSLENCEDPTWTVIVQTSFILTIGSHVKPNPGITRPGNTDNCWKVANEVTPCPVPPPYVLTSVTTYTDCEECAALSKCYELQNCQVLGAIIYVTTSLSLNPGDVISLLPGEIPPGYDAYPNCWSVVQETPCNGSETLVTSVTIQVDCPTCLGIVYLLTPCDGSQPYCTYSDLSAYVGGPTINIAGMLGCFTVTIGTDPCPAPVSAPPGFISPCVCPSCYIIQNCSNSAVQYTVSSVNYPGLNTVISITSVFTIPPGLPNCWTVKNEVPCEPTTPTITYNTEIDCPTCIGIPDPECYKLTSCDGLTIIYSSTDLSLFVGQTISNVPGYSGICFNVTLAVRGQCFNPISIPSPQPCICECYQLVDCLTNQPYLKLYNPTSNGVDLSLIVGQAVSKVCIDPNLTECVTGCWRVDTAANCNGAVVRAVADIKQDCETCLEKCYALRDCNTQQIVFTISYTTPNINLPNPSTLVGQSIGNVCFTQQHGGCVSGCYYLDVVSTSTCTDSIDWTEVVSYTAYQTCLACKSSCYLLEPCDNTLSPIIVNNDLGVYLNQVVNVCLVDPLGQESCACYTVRISQTCDNAISIPNPTSVLDSCDSCTYCYCPPGYQKVGDICQKILSSPVSPSREVYSVVAGPTSPSNGSLGTNFYSNVSSAPYPISESGNQFIDAGLNVVNSVNVSTPGTVWAGPIGGRLNTAGVWTSLGPGQPFNEWIGFTHCIDVATTQKYCVGIAANDNFRITIDGVLAVQATNAVAFNYNTWHVFEFNLVQGFHIIQLEVLNIAGSATFGAEIYKSTALTLQGLTSVFQLQGVTIFSTFNKTQTPSIFDIGDNSGYQCPVGSSFNGCSNNPSCTTIQTVPYIDCPKTYKIIDCEGKQADFITNDDLSAYVNNNVFKVCIPEENPVVFVNFPRFILTDCKGLVLPFCTGVNLAQYIGTNIVLVGYPGSCFTVSSVPPPGLVNCPSPIPVTVDTVATCNCNPPQPSIFILTDCKDLTPPICTITNLYAHLNTYVVLNDYPDSCFIVTAGTPGQICNPPVEVVLNEQATCNCNPPDPQTPWPPGCYCVTVEPADSAIGDSFDGVFGDGFASCPDCQRICYNLTDCNGTADPIKVTGVDLADCVGSYVKIKDCEDICWLVEEADNCDGCIKVAEVIECFTTCDLCNPPVEPVIPELKLNTRPVTPGYKTLNCSPEYYDKVTCNYADQIYTQMLSTRYGLQTCCEDGLDKWEIKKELIDLQSLKNPNLP